MRTSVMRAVVISLVVLAHLQLLVTAEVGSTPNQSQQTTAFQPATVRGKILEAGTGVRLADVQVSLHFMARSASSKPVHAITNSSGEFEVRNLPPGFYTVFLRKEGYARAGFHFEAPQTLLGLEPAEIRENVDFTLTRASSFEGRVFDETGKPLPRIEVFLSRAGKVGKQHQFRPAARSTADDQGIFLVKDLVPGSYTLSARSMVLVGLREKRFPLTHYPGVSRAENAVPIEVPAGATLKGYDLVLRPITGYSIGGKVLLLDGSPTSRASLSIRFVDGRIDSTAELSTTLSSEKFAVGNLEPGTYQVIAKATHSGKTLQANRILALGRSNMTDLVLSLEEPRVLAGRITVEGVSQPVTSSDLLMGLVAPDRRFHVTNTLASIADDLSFRVSNLTEGQYRFRVQALGRNLYLRSVRIGDTEAVDTPVLLGNSKDPPVQVVLAADGGQLTGTVQNSDGVGPAQAVTLVVFASNPGLRGLHSRFTRVARTDQRGRFEIEALVPGDYLVCSVTNFPFGAENDVEYLRRLEPLALRVNLSASQTVSLSITRKQAPLLE